MACRGAEREIIEAQLEAARAYLTPSDIDTVTSEAELDVDAAAGWIQVVVPGVFGVPPTGAARLAAAALRALRADHAQRPAAGAAQQLVGRVVVPG
jgi:MoxR-like ATPase